MVDDKLSRRILTAAGILGATAIAIGAFGAHGLEKFLLVRNVPLDVAKERCAQYATGAHYHLLHAVALLALTQVPYGTPLVRKIIAGLFIAGIVLFSGSLYVLALTNTPKLGAITPIGGLCWIVAWAMLVFIAQKSKG